MKLIIYLNPQGLKIAKLIEAELKDTCLIAFSELTGETIEKYEHIIFIGALGICVRALIPHINDKHKDPGIICIDSLGKNVISVLSGHVGEANKLTKEVGAILGAYPVITTQSDNMGIWPLDTLGKEFGWEMELADIELNSAIAEFVNGKSIGLLLDIRDRGTNYLENSLPENIRIIKKGEGMEGLEMIIAVTPYIYDFDIPVLYFRPPILNLGFSCRKDCDPEGISTHIKNSLTENKLSPLSVKSVSTIDLKKDERTLSEFQKWKTIKRCNIYSAQQLENIKVPNPSEKVNSVAGVKGVAESAALLSSNFGTLVIEKQKGKLKEGSDFTFAVAIDKGALRGGHIEIVGAGPGDPELISLRGKYFLQMADLILYAGSLVPKELTEYSKPGCKVRSSASMTLKEQFELMKEFYMRDLLVVRLHTGDPCIYGAIQEQMAFFDKNGMHYHITPGISAFQAAAAALRSQFTIPEKVQTIILTRGEGRTPMPEKEKLSNLARSQSTMCIYLSAGIVDEVQKDLLTSYPPTTSVAVCYKLTWKEEKIFRGELKDLANIVHENNLTLTTLLIVGDAIDNREGLSHLYSENFKHLFRK